LPARLGQVALPDATIMAVHQGCPALIRLAMLNASLGEQLTGLKVGGAVYGGTADGWPYGGGRFGVPVSLADVVDADGRRLFEDDAIVWAFAEPPFRSA
jgi:hypothetical protein